MNLLNFVLGNSGEVSDATNPALWLVNTFSGARTASGQRVNHDSAMGLSTYYACLNRLSVDLAKLPCILYRRLPNGGKERATDHPLYALLHDAPNRDMTPITFIQTVQHFGPSWGSGYAEIERDGTGRPLALWPIHSSRVDPRRDGNGNLFYRVWVNDIRKGMSYIPIDSEDMFHIPGLGPNGIGGYSVLRLAAESLGLSLAAQKFGASFFGNGAHANGVLMHPGKLKKEAKDYLRQSWQELHGGADNAHKTAILEEGMKFEKITIPPEEAQMLQTRQFQVEDVCRWFSVPPSKIGHLPNAKGWATVEATNLDYLTDAIMPWAVRWKQEITRKLLSPKERGQYFAEFLYDALLQVDTAARGEFYTKMIGIGALNVNEIREKENMNPVEGGETRFVPLNWQTLEQAKVPKQAPAPGAISVQPKESDSDETPAAKVERCRGLFADSASRVMAMTPSRKEPEATQRVDFCGRAFSALFLHLGADLNAGKIAAIQFFKAPTDAAGLCDCMMGAALAALLTKEKNHVAA